MPFVLAVGITGHRRDALPAGEIGALTDRLRDVLTAILDLANNAFLTNRDFYSDAPPRLLFVSPLADGADQIAAEIALELGFELRAILPFQRDRYREDMSDPTGRLEFDSLLSRASCVLELPGHSDHLLEAYVMAGRATVAHSDLLIAVWDGLPPRGRGGTGEVVRLAHDRAKPTIHIPTSVDHPVTLRWGAFEPAVVTDADDPGNVRPFSNQELDNVLSALVSPPPDPQERAFIRKFQSECRRRVKARIEYPLLLAATGVSRFRRHHWRADAAFESTRQEWQTYVEACERVQSVSGEMPVLRSSYEWADGLATHFAQSYRSGHVFNFVLGAVAVLLGTLNLVIPSVAIFLEISLFLAVLAILANTWAANELEWHRRWLDYRQLAERLRLMRSLKLLAVAAPDAPGSAANPVSQRWIEWYSAAVWRAIGCPSGYIDGPRLGAIAATVAEREIQPQVAYHHKVARQVARLDHRLGVLGYSVFTLALVSSAVLLTGFAFAPGWVHQNYSWFTVISAGLPAIGTAIVGIKAQGDHSASAIRSEQTAVRLDHIDRRLATERNSLVHAADLTEQAARAMLSDLDEWRLLNQQHDLSIA